MERVLEPEVMDTVEEAESYDAMDHSAANLAFCGRLLELGARGSVLDVGTGPGHVPLMLCDMSGDVEVAGVDLSREMLRIAAEHLEASAHGDRVRFLLGDAKGLDFPDGAFDAVCSNTILHHIPDPVDFLREAWRVRRDGGAFLVRDLYRPPDEAAADALVREHAAGESAHARELLRASLCAALTPDELRDAARAAGIEGAEVVVDSDRHMSLQRATG